MVQWLRLRSQCRGMGLIPGWGTKILQAAAKKHNKTKQRKQTNKQKNLHSEIQKVRTVLSKSYVSAICKASPDNHFAFLHFFFQGTVLITASCMMLGTSVWPRERTGHSKHSPPTSQETTLHMDIISALEGPISKRKELGLTDSNITRTYVFIGLTTLKVLSHELSVLTLTTIT